MMTKRQGERVNAFLADVGGESVALFSRLIECLEALGYYPRKEGPNLSFKHDAHSKQMAKMGMRTGKEVYPFFALRFSACRGYSKRFADIVEAAIRRFPKKVAMCAEGSCSYCAGAPHEHVYMHSFPEGVRRHCGAYALEITELSEADLPEIQALIRAEHAYLMAHEAAAQTEGVSGDG